MTEAVDFNPDNTAIVVDINKNKAGAHDKMVSPGDAPPSLPALEKPKLSPAQVQAHLVEYLDRAAVKITTPSPLRGLTQFPYDFRVFRAKRDDAPVIAEVVNKTAFLTFPANIQSALATHCGIFSGFESCYNITLPQAENVVRWWMYKPRDFAKLPPTWGFKSQGGVCFNRLAYDPEPVTSRDEFKKLAPTFYEMLTRTSNLTSFCARLGSMFFEKANRKQVGCLYGASGGGKSQLEAILRALLGTSVATFKNDDFDDKFIMAEFVDKRTAVIEECERDFYRSVWFKIFTGARNVRIRKMHTQGCPGEINTILWTVSNEPPEIPNDPALKNRIIPWEVKPIREERKLPELEVHRRLKEEAPYIAWLCIKIYQLLCPNHEEIPYSKERHLQPLIDEYEKDSIDKFDRTFVYDLARSMPSNLFEELCQRAGVKDMKSFKQFILARYPKVVFNTSKKYGSKNVKSVKGIGQINHR